MAALFDSRPTTTAKLTLKVSPDYTRNHLPRITISCQPYRYCWPHQAPGKNSISFRFASVHRLLKASSS